MLGYFFVDCWFPEGEIIWPVSSQDMFLPFAVLFMKLIDLTKEKLLQSVWSKVCLMRMLKHACFSCLSPQSGIFAGEGLIWAQRSDLSMSAVPWEQSRWWGIGWVSHGTGFLNLAAQVGEWRPKDAGNSWDACHRGSTEHSYFVLKNFWCSIRLFDLIFGGPILCSTLQKLVQNCPSSRLSFPNTDIV